MTLRSWSKMPRKRKRSADLTRREPPPKSLSERIYAAIVAIFGVLFLFVAFFGGDDARYGHWPYHALALFGIIGLSLAIGDAVLRFWRKDSD